MYFYEFMTESLAAEFFVVRAPVEKRDWPAPKPTLAGLGAAAFGLPGFIYFDEKAVAATG